MIVAITGGKGGVGKSTTAWNLAGELDAVVVDADFATAALPPGDGDDLRGVLAGRLDPVEAVQTFGSVKLLPCGRSLPGVDGPCLESLGTVLERVERVHGDVIVDCPAGLGTTVASALEAATCAVLVTMPEKAAMIDGYRSARFAAAHATPVAAVAFNMAERASHAELGARYGRKLGAGVTLVERQQAVADAQARWLPVAAYDPVAQAVDAYRELARRLDRSKGARVH